MSRNRDQHLRQRLRKQEQLRRSPTGRLTYDVYDYVEVVDPKSAFYGVVGLITEVEPAANPNQYRYTLKIGHLTGLVFRGKQVRGAAL